MINASPSKISFAIYFTHKTQIPNIFSANNLLVNNGNTRKKCEINFKIMIKTPE